VVMSSPAFQLAQLRSGQGEGQVPRRSAYRRNRDVWLRNDFPATVTSENGIL
jgi:hypothetical protein